MGVLVRWTYLLLLTYDTYKYDTSLAYVQAVGSGLSAKPYTFEYRGKMDI
jgi:hypothetical protein